MPLLDVNAIRAALFLKIKYGLVCSRTFLLLGGDVEKVVHAWNILSGLFVYTVL
jgi:hypothetical protein